MYDILFGIAKSAAEEFGKSAAGELGKVAVKAVFSRSDESERDERDLAESDEPPNIADYAHDIADHFFASLAAADRAAALEVCDREWAVDPQRRDVLLEILNAAPPVEWTLGETLVPKEWNGRSDPEWVLIHAVVTYDYGGGRLEGVPASLLLAPTPNGLLLWTIEWTAAEEGEKWGEWDEEAEADSVDLADLFDFGTPHEAHDPAAHAEAPPTHLTLPCTRCPQMLRVPAHEATMRVKCPSCWTQQMITIVQCTRCPERFQVTAEGGSRSVRCPKCWTHQKLGT